MKVGMLLASLVITGSASLAHAVNVYMFSSGSPIIDDAASLALTQRGHTVTIGVVYTAFDGTIPLVGFDTVYLQANFNWTTGLMPINGQAQLVSWTRNGGRLVTSEWVVYFSGPGSNFAVVAEVLPLSTPGGFHSVGAITMMQEQPNQSINAGMPTSFICPLNNFSGTETFAFAKAGASNYYRSDNVPAGSALAGWRVGSGFAYSFSTTCGEDQVADPVFGRLFANVMSAITPPCETADFNGDGDAGTDADIEAYFSCLGGNCCATCPPTADFDGDGDIGTDADIESFFRVLAGGGC